MGRTIKITPPTLHILMEGTDKIQKHTQQLLNYANRTGMEMEYLEALNNSIEDCIATKNMLRHLVRQKSIRLVLDD